MKFSKLTITIILFTGIVCAGILFLSGKSFHTITGRILLSMIGILIILGINELKEYLNLSMQIKKGINLINSGYSWNTQYLKITKNPANDHEIFVTNDILWIEQGTKKKCSDDILLKILISDFEKISRKTQLKKYLVNKKVTFKLS